jgi:muconolactone delta-isomerase
VWRTLGLWGADDQGDLMSILQSLPLYDWMTVDATPLLVHPSDPANGRA